MELHYLVFVITALVATNVASAVEKRHSHLEVLVDLVATGNFEVSICAFNIIKDFDFVAETMQRLQTQLDKYEINHLPFEHGPEAHTALTQLISNHRKSSGNSA